jgi:hypothetical protein
MSLTVWRLQDLKGGATSLALWCYLDSQNAKIFGIECSTMRNGMYAMSVGDRENIGEHAAQ